MADFSTIIPGTLKWEGGWADDPDDPGGQTMRGIIEKFFAQYGSLIGCHGTIEELKALTEAQARELYRLTLWNSIQGDKIECPGMAAQIFDAHVNFDELAIADGMPMNGGPSIVMLQHSLDILADGSFGPETLNAVNSASQPGGFDSLLQAHLAHYDWLVSVRPGFSKYLDGWKDRANSWNYLRPA